MLCHTCNFFSFCSLSGPLATPRIVCYLVLLWTCITPSFNNAQTRREGFNFRQTSFSGKSCHLSPFVRLDVLLMGKMFLECVKMVVGRVPSVVSNTYVWSVPLTANSIHPLDTWELSIVYRRKTKCLKLELNFQSLAEWSAFGGGGGEEVLHPLPLVSDVIFLCRKLSKNYWCNSLYLSNFREHVWQRENG